MIVPTSALAERGVFLRRALDSVLAQEGVRAVPLVIVNGPQADAGIKRALAADDRLRVTILEQASLPAALLTGRGLVDTPFFAELDDDDMLMPGALAQRVHALAESPDCGAVVTNGVLRSERGDELHFADAAEVERDPLRALVQRNWLIPGSWLCRTDAVPPSVIAGMPKYLECTYFAIQLSMHCRIRVLDRPTVVRHVDSPLAVSQSREYLIGQVAALRRILELDLPADVHAVFRARVSDACHANADLCLRHRNHASAWGWHLRSLREPGGLRHGRFTLRLLLRRPRSQ